MSKLIRVLRFAGNKHLHGGFNLTGAWKMDLVILLAVTLILALIARYMDMSELQVDVHVPYLAGPQQHNVDHI